MKKILVLLVSEQPIPNVIVAAHYMPDIIWFISTKDMEDKKRSDFISNTLRMRGIRFEAEKRIVDHNSFIDCVSTLESLCEDAGEDVEYIVNITGGTKIMAIAAYEVFRGIGVKVVIDYMPLGKNEIVRLFPRKQPLKIFEVKVRLNLEQYLSSFGFRIQNKEDFDEIKARISDRKDISKWIFDNYEDVNELLFFMHKDLRERRNDKAYKFSAEFGRDFTSVENDFLMRNNFKVRGRLIEKDLLKHEIVYLTGGWYEEYIFNEVYQLVEDGVLDDAMLGVVIESANDAVNELDIAFVKNNFFYHIECKTLGDEDDQSIIRDELYKKGAISALLGKGDKRAMICTTLNKIEPSVMKRASDYGIEVFTRQEASNLNRKIDIENDNPYKSPSPCGRG